MEIKDTLKDSVFSQTKIEIEKEDESISEFVQTNLDKEMKEAEEKAKKIEVESKTDKTFIDRLANEINELEAKYDKLVVFINSDKFNEIEDARQKNLLLEQQNAMTLYLDILGQRLELLLVEDLNEENEDENED